MKQPIAIGRSGWRYSPGWGVTLTAPNGRSVYFQPGDHAAAFYETLAALDELDDGATRECVIFHALAPYFD